MSVLGGRREAGGGRTGGGGGSGVDGVGWTLGLRTDRVCLATCHGQQIEKYHKH